MKTEEEIRNRLQNFTNEFESLQKEHDDKTLNTVGMMMKILNEHQMLLLKWVLE